ncbi:MAG: thioredoxin [Limnochordales bacterium]|nr:thioredoxin [Limnochordales bacterium]
MRNVLEAADRVKLYARLLARWGEMLKGRSYWHVAQQMGKHFVEGELRGYFNDLTAKTAWAGPVDDRGLPLNRVNGRSLVHFPTTLFQKALGHWDRWLEQGMAEDENKNAFLLIADWAVKTQDDKGGWSVWPLLGMNLPSPYSAMTQGQGISILVRAHMCSGQRVFLEAARLALGPLCTTVEQGGTRRVVPEGSILEEVPYPEPNGVLNGWIFGLFGLYDYLLVDRDVGAAVLLEESLKTLVTYLPRYNAGYWSYYDLSGNLASPFYHRLHVAQLIALEKTFPKYSSAFGEIRRIFIRQESLQVNRIRAVILKAYQKVKNPPKVILE